MGEPELKVSDVVPACVDGMLLFRATRDPDALQKAVRGASHSSIDTVGIVTQVEDKCMVVVASGIAEPVKQVTLDEFVRAAQVDFRDPTKLRYQVFPKLLARLEERALDAAGVVRQQVKRFVAKAVSYCDVTQSDCVPQYGNKALYTTELPADVALATGATLTDVDMPARWLDTEHVDFRWYAENVLESCHPSFENWRLLTPAALMCSAHLKDPAFVTAGAQPQSAPNYALFCHLAGASVDQKRISALNFWGDLISKYPSQIRIESEVIKRGVDDNAPVSTNYHFRATGIPQGITTKTFTLTLLTHDPAQNQLAQELLALAANANIQPRGIHAVVPLAVPVSPTN